MQKQVFIFLTFIHFSFGAISQINPPNPTVPSANLGKIGLEIGNDLYNGKVNVSVPIFNHSFEGVSIPIALSYSGGNGIKPDELPSWVGLGWGLQAGGFIHRTVRGKPDEALDFKTHITTLPNSSYSEKETTLHSTDYSYFSNTNKLNITGWETGSYATTFNTTLPNIPYTSPYQLYGLQTWINLYPKYDLVPDEFSFSMGGISGKFYLNHVNKWIVESNDGKHYTVDVVTGEQTVYDKSGVFYGTPYHIVKKIPRIIKYLTLTSIDGIKYYFGNSDVNAPYEQQYFEYSRSSTVLPTSGPLAPLPGGLFLDIVPHTWHLTKIENLRTASVITFSYKQQGLQFYKTKQAWATGGTQTTGGQIVYTNSQYSYTDPDNESSLYRLSAISKVVTRNWTLTGITFPDGVKIDFISTPSTQLSTDEPLSFSDFAGFHEYDDMYYYPGYSGQTNTLLKLDKILVSYNNEQKKEIDFAYSNSSSQRLQLTSVKEVNLINSDLSEYKFGYNNAVSLPVYGAGKSDHWGYYNGQDFFSTTPANNFTNLSTTYTASRAPNANNAAAEILNKVTYPTGGSAEFIYESHKYSKKRNANDFTISDLGITSDAGGLRIKKIRYFHLGSTLSSEKEFDYNIPGSTSLSSGVLSSPAPNYIFGTAASYWFRVTGFNPTYYEGNHVTYTYVAEKETGNGRTQYEYTNYDNGYNDAPPIMTSSSGAINFEGGYSRKIFKRGKPKNIKVINEAGTTINEKIFEYEHDEDESTKEEIRSLYLDITVNAYASVLDKIYQDYNISSEERTYSNNGTLIQTQNSSYDQYGNVSQIISNNSKGRIIRKKFKYNYQYSSSGTDDASVGIKYLNDKGIKTALIETITFLENADGTNPNVLGASLNTYKTYSPLPDKIYNLQITSPIQAAAFQESTVTGASFIKDPRYNDEDVQYGNYDTRENLLQINPRNNIKTSFQWDYNQSYQTVKIINAENSKRTYIQNIPGAASRQVYWQPYQMHQQSFNFEQLSTGSITLGLNFWYTYPSSGNVTMNMSYSLTGPSSASGTLCIGSSGNCTFPNLTGFSNMPPGMYTLSVYLWASDYVGVLANLSYQGSTPQLITNGIKEFLYEGFEESGNALSNPYAGKKYYNGDYSVSFALPNSRNYKINYHYLQSGNWKNITKDYTGPTTTLSEGDAIDEVRIYPSDAMMTTYTYEPLVGLTSETDPNGKSVFYEYDPLHRLRLIRDEDKNILKKICYNYAGQPENCLDIYYNGPKSGDFTRNNCGSGIPTTVTYSVAANTYSSTISKEAADQLAQNDVDANGQNYANTHGECSNPTFSLDYVNYTGEEQYIMLTNTSTSEFFSFYASAYSSGNLGYIPEGNYDIQIWSPGYFFYTYEAGGCGYSTAGFGGNFYNVPLNVSCHYITISPNW